MSETVSLRWAEDGSTIAVADHIEQLVGNADRPVIAVPGGSTPVAIFGELARRGLDWSGASLMLGDDRQVPLDHSASNQAKIETAFAGTRARILPLEEGMEVPDLDLLWIGMGEDGHIASLFPDMACKNLPGRRVIRTVPRPLPPEAPYPRLSMNMEALTQAPRQIILVIRGEKKKAIIEEVLEYGGDLPVAQLIGKARAPITVYWSLA